jgi:RNA polymerase sigma-70 factor (ECF subfamily)
MTAKEFNNAVDEFSDNIFRFALKHLKNEMSAKDIVQDTFTKVWVKHEEVTFEKVKSYLFTTAYNAIIDFVKKEKRSYEMPAEDISRGTQQDNFDVQTILNTALETLPEIQKTVVLLRDYEGYSYEEIGKICKLKEAQVKVYIFRARQTLKVYLKNIELIV